MAVASSRTSKTRDRAAAAPSPKTASKPAAGKSSAKASSLKKAAKPIELHFWPTPNGWKISIMLEECGIAYQTVVVNIGRGEQLSSDYLKLSPNGRIPAILDPEGPGGKPLSVFESGAILQYLGRKTGRFYPADERARVDVDQWLFWQMAGLGPIAGQAQHFRHFAPETIPYAIERYTVETARLYGVMNRHLADRDYLAAKYSIADISCFTWIMSAQMQGQKLEDYPHLKAWFNRINARPAVVRGLAVGKELRMAPPADLRARQDSRRIVLNNRIRP